MLCDGSLKDRTIEEGAKWQRGGGGNQWFQWLSMNLLLCVECGGTAEAFCVCVTYLISCDLFCPKID